MPTIIYTPIDAPKPCGRAPIRHDTHRDQRRHHEPKVRPHTQRSQTYGHDTHTRRWLVLTIEGCPQGNRSNRPQIRYPNTLPHTGRRRELISSGTPIIDAPRPAHESQRYKACCKRPKDPTHRRDRTGRLVCAPSAGSRTTPPAEPQGAAAVAVLLENRHRILTFYDTLFQGILAKAAADGAFLDYNSGRREGLQIGGVSSALFIRHY
jgi:hypothetical protein